ncbi:MAG: AAA family ATPase [Tepidisphaeraceae bacterium]
MFIQLTALVVDADEGNRNELATFLSMHGITTLGVLANAEQLSQHLSRGDKPQMVIANLDPGAMDNLRAFAPLIRQYPEVSFFVMSQVLDPNLLMEAMHTGVKEFIPLPIVEAKFKAALERLAASHGMSSKGKVINVIPAMGGVGSTTVACNIAASLAQQGLRTVLVDLDLVRGGVAGCFDQRPRFTIADIMSSADSIDRQVLENAIVTHQKSGVAILARPDLPEDSQRVNAHGFSRLLNVLGRMYEWIVVDSMMSIDPIYATAISAATLNMMVMQLNVPCAKNTERFVGTLRRMGIEASKIKIVVNRFVKKGWDIEPDEVEKSLGLKLSWMVPNDFKNAIAAINYGEPVVIRSPRSEMSTSLIELSQYIAGPTNLAKAA